MYDVMNSRPFSKTAWVTLAVFMISMFQPVVQVWATESNFYDGPGGYLERTQTDAGMKRVAQLQNQRASDTNKIVGMAIGGAVGGGLVLALGMAASPVLAIGTVVGSILAGGYLGDKFGSQAHDRVHRRTRNPSFMSWAGGLVGGTLGFMVPGGSVVGAAVGAGLGGAAGNHFAQNRDRRGDLPSRLFDGGAQRMGGGFMGPIGAMGGAFDGRVSLMGAQGMHGDPRWYSRGGNFQPGHGYGRQPYTAYGTSMYSWHDDNGDLAYPGYENDLYRLDDSARLQRTAPDWSMGGRSASVFSSGGGSIDNPDWGGARAPQSDSDYGDVYSTHTTSDGETFDPDYRGGEYDNLADLQRRYQNALQELSSLTQMNAPEVQRREAHAEVRRLETLMRQRMGR